MAKFKRRKVFLGAMALLMASTFGFSACVPQDDNFGSGNSSDSSSSSGVAEPPDYLKEGTYVGVNGYEEQLKLNGKFYADYSSIEEAFRAGVELNVQLAEEGFVLLKNENNALPLSNKETGATAFGYKAFNLQESGGGSGAAQTSYLATYGLERSTLKTSLTSVGMKLNPATESLYSGVNRELDPETFGTALQNTYAAYNDVAIIVFARGGSEGSDLSSTVNEDGDHSLSLSVTEEALIRHAKANFKKVVVLINSANCMELGDLQEKKTADNLGVDAILQIAHVGVDGAAAIGPILTGEVNPSGHTVDIWEKDFTKGPSYTNFGSMAQNGVDETTGANYNNHYYMDGTDVTNSVGRTSVEYREDIYMGYKWYETAHADMNKKTAGTGDAWYDNAVVYPFGHGLSYTTFDWELAEDIAPEADITKANQTVTMKVKVTNTGDVAGKDVVQVYVTPPYQDGGIEKAEVNLMGFAKTKLLQPGESDIVTVQFAAQDFASFDWNDKNANDFAGYELEAGDYVISARSDSHTVQASVTRTIKEDILCETDLSSGAKINAVFSQTEGGLAWYNTTNDALLNNLTTREGGLDGVAPASSTAADRTITQADVDGWKYYQDTPAYADDESDPWYVKEVPDSWTQESKRESGKGKTEIQLYEMAGVPLTEPVLNADGTITLGNDAGSQKWNEFMNQLTWEEMEAFVFAGGWGRRAIPAIGKPEEADQDGPNQLGTQAGRADPENSPGVPSRGGDLNNGNGLGSGVSFLSSVIVASTWNVELAEAEGRLMGNFSLFLNIPGWYGPGMNIHRSPFGGRNFEYYSEDGILAGKIAASVIRGATQKGVVCYPKHIGLNEQETNRSNINSFATEQALREIYLKGYEIAAKEGGAMGYMTAMSYLGTWACYSNGALQNELFRKEFGYKGIFITDANGSGGEFKTLGIMLRNGTDYNLARTTMITTDTDKDGILNAEATIWDPTARNGKGGVKVAANEETREAAYKALFGGWTEGIGGTTEFKYYNWLNKASVAEMLTLDSATYYYWLRLACMHTLYDSANSNAMNNGMPSWMWHGDAVATLEVSATVDNRNRVTLSVSDVASALDLEDGVMVTNAYFSTKNKLAADDSVDNYNNTGFTVSRAGVLAASTGSVASGDTRIMMVTIELDYYHLVNVLVKVTVA